MSTSAGQQLPAKINRKKARAGVDGFVAGRSMTDSKMNFCLESCYSNWLTAECRHEHTFPTTSVGLYMNAWKVIWNVFYNGSSRWRVATEMWRLATAWQRILVCVLALLFLAGLIIYLLPSSRSASALFATVAAEVFLLLALDKIKDQAFFSEYGSPEHAMAPPDNEEHRVSRYMIFRKRLRDTNITKSHVEDAFPLADAKLNLESSRGEMPKKYLGFAIGLFAGLLVAWSKNLEVQELAWAIAGFVAVSFFIVMVLWVIPSRSERLKELKYFMLLYCREVE